MIKHVVNISFFLLTAIIDSCVQVIIMKHVVNISLFLLTVISDSCA